jgi:predicted RND superfamily exporter protein
MSMIPNIAPIAVVLGLMGWLGVPLDGFTVMIASIAIGIGVDDTIHFLHHFRKAYDGTPDVQSAVRETLHTTGRALVITSLVLSGGFFIYTASFLNSNIRFGWLAGCAVLLALAADVFLVPALLALAMRRTKSIAHQTLKQPTAGAFRISRD